MTGDDKDRPTNPSDSLLNPRQLRVARKDWDQILAHITANPHLALFDREARSLIAKRRARAFDESRRWDGDDASLVSFAVDYNEGHMNRFLESHVVRLIRPLSIIDPIYESARTAKVLSVGPRNENELFHLLAYGFLLENIDAIDLVANSPLVTVMDMHDLTYENASFDVVISGWTLPYSRSPKRALAEKMRVLRPNGLLCLGLTRVPPDHQGHTDLAAEGATNYLSADQLLADIREAAGEDSVARVEFRHEPLDLTRKGAILLIVRKS